MDGLKQNRVVVWLSNLSATDVKWYIFWDSLTRNRSDGALLRLTAQIKPSQGVEEVDRKLAAFTKAINGQLSAYLPK